MGSDVNSIFEFIKPLPAQDDIVSYSWILRRNDQMITIKLRKNDIILNGQMLHLGQYETMMFLGSPMLNDITQTAKYGLQLNDFAMYDQGRDLILMQQAAKTSVEENTELAQRNTALKELSEQLADEKKKSETLLLNILPSTISERLNKFPNVTPVDHFKSATILFADIVGILNESKNRFF